MQTVTEVPQEPTQTSKSQPNSVNPPPRWNRVVWRTLRLLLLAITVTALWLTIEDRWGSNFQLPTRYEYDAHYILGMMKLAQEGDLGLFTHIYTDSLGAPFTGQLNDFPQTERVIIWLGGQIARFTGLIPAANIMLILSCIVAALSFYLAARLWKISRLLSWLFALPYAFLPHTLRSIEHLGIIFTGILPFQFYVLWYVATTQKLCWRSWRFKLTIAISLCSGLLNIYWIFLFLQLYALALICRLIKVRRGIVKAFIPLVLACLVSGLFFGSFIAYKINYGENLVAIVRNYGGVEQWSLKPIDLFLPGRGTSFGAISDFLSRYYHGGRISIGEAAGSYIGFCAGFGLLFLLFEGIRRQINKRSPSIAWLAAVWLIAYSCIGGIHSVFSLVFEFYNIRATNRYSTAIATVGLLYFTFLTYRATLKWPFAFKLPVFAGIALLGLAEQSYRSYRFIRYAVPIKEHVEEDRRLVSKLEGSLSSGNMIYILPVTDFPEPFWGRGAGRADFGHYQAMRPFLYSTKLRYSYGSHKGRQGADWQLDVQELPAGEMATALESYGFAGILLNRKGYEDRGEALLAELAQAGWSMEFEQGIDNEWVFIRLTPAETPVLPTLTPYAVTDSRE